MADPLTPAELAELRALAEQHMRISSGRDRLAAAIPRLLDEVERLCARVVELEAHRLLAGYTHDGEPIWLAAGTSPEQAIVAAVEQARAEEREACAALADGMINNPPATPQYVARAIRARKP